MRAARGPLRAPSQACGTSRTRSLLPFACRRHRTSRVATPHRPICLDWCAGTTDLASDNFVAHSRPKRRSEDRRNHPKGTRSESERQPANALTSCNTVERPRLGQPRRRLLASLGPNVELRSTPYEGASIGDYEYPQATRHEAADTSRVSRGAESRRSHVRRGKRQFRRRSRNYGFSARQPILSLAGACTFSACRASAR